MATILIADSADSREQIAAQLPDTRYLVVGAEGEAAAFHVAQSAAPQLMLVALDHPRIDGFALAERVAGWIGSDRELPNIPLVLLHGEDADVDQDRIDRSGARGILTKPVDAETLSMILEVLLPLPPLADSAEADLSAAPPATSPAAPPPPVVEPETDSTAEVASAREPAGIYAHDFARVFVDRPHPTMPERAFERREAEPTAAQPTTNPLEKVIRLVVTDHLEQILDAYLQEISARVIRKLTPKLEQLILAAIAKALKRQPKETETDHE